MERHTHSDDIEEIADSHEKQPRVLGKSVLARWEDIGYPTPVVDASEFEYDNPPDASNIFRGLE